jgi:hypothetical protein
MNGGARILDPNRGRLAGSRAGAGSLALHYYETALAHNDEARQSFERLKAKLADP